MMLRMKEEEAIEERRRREAEEQVRQVDFKRKQAQLENPGFSIVGLAQVEMPRLPSPSASLPGGRRAGRALTQPARSGRS